MPQAARKNATYDDVLAAPEHVIAEIIDGELYLSARPASPHARAASHVGADLIPAFDRPKPGPPGPGGWWILFEPELHLDGHTLVPDLAGWRRETLPVLPDVPFFTTPPDWVCEVLSPSTARRDRIQKMDLWARYGISYAWLVDPDIRILEAYRHSSGLLVRVGAWGGDDVARAAPFDAIEIELANLWMPDGGVKPTP